MRESSVITNAVFWKITLIITCLKIFLIPAYRSTDFEVHRNWLAITHSLPVSEWYHSNISLWTLDYPPLFAWMEKCLSYPAQLVDPGMLQVLNLDYASFATIVFQRLSVVLTDFVLVYAVSEFVKHSRKETSRKNTDMLTNPQLILVFLFLTNFGLILVDHIHFQYNGLLFGILVLSIVRIYQDRHLEGSFWFAVLLNMKHIYLYISPAYGLYLLRSYCLENKDKERRWSRVLVRFISLAAIVVSVFLFSFAPFLTKDQLLQVISRLFPFKRGLCHAYWAPNFWALYNMADKVLTVSGSKLHLLPNSSVLSASMTGGLVQEFEHIVLPSIKPIHTLVITVISIMPALVHLWVHPTGARGFVRAIFMCAYGSFMFGWHVHEKAILIMIIPLIFLVLEKRDARLFLLLTSVGNYSLFPLIHTNAETLIKYALYSLTMILSFYSLGNLHNDKGTWYRLPLLTVPETIYIAGLLGVEAYHQVLHRLLGLDVALPFLPLMLTSVYCAVGILYIWLAAYRNLFRTKMNK